MTENSQVRAVRVVKELVAEGIVETALHDPLRNRDATFSLKDVEWKNIRGQSYGEFREIGRRKLFLPPGDICY